MHICGTKGRWVSGVIRSQVGSLIPLGTRNMSLSYWLNVSPELTQSYGPLVYPEYNVYKIGQVNSFHPRIIYNTPHKICNVYFNFFLSIHLFIFFVLFCFSSIVRSWWFFMIYSTIFFRYASYHQHAANISIYMISLFGDQWHHMVTKLLVNVDSVNSSPPGQNGLHFADDMFKCIFLNKNIWISNKISLKYVPWSLIDNMLALVQVMAWRHSGNKSLSEPMLTHFNHEYMRH